MTLPKGFESGDEHSHFDISKMIGRRVEDYVGIITIGYIAAWLGTFGGVTVATTYYPWAYPPPSAHFALGGLTGFESIGYLFMVKVATEGTNKVRRSNKLITLVIAGIGIATVLAAIFD